MRLSHSSQDEVFRGELVAFLDEHCPQEAYATRTFIGSDTEDDQGVTIIPDWARDWQARLFDHGWMIPSYTPELGGRNATPTQTLIYLEELAARGIPRSVHFVGYAIAGPSLLEFGNDEQKALAPAAIRGDTIWCAGMSEPSAGSDLANLSTRAVLEGDHFRVNGQKVWTSYAMLASKCLCYVRTNPDVRKHRGISALIVDMDTPGIEETEHPKYCHNLIDGHPKYAFKNVRIPDANRFGEVGEGLSVSKEWFLHERTMIAARCCGAARRLIDEASEFAQNREQGGSRISEYQLIQQMLADSLTEMWAARLMTFATAKAMDEAQSEEDLKKVHAKSAMAKLYASEMGCRVADRAVQIFGGRGYMRENVAERFFRELRVERIWEGSSEIQRIIIANSLYKRGAEALTS